jgi:hypothetical protein
MPPVSPQFKFPPFNITNSAVAQILWRDHKQRQSALIKKWKTTKNYATFGSVIFVINATTWRMRAQLLLFMIKDSN